jgi:HK97 family phage major capsid protein
MLDKTKLEDILAQTETLQKRVDEYEAKSKKLEEENISLKSMVHKTTNSINSDEAQTLRYFGCSHPAELLKKNIGHPDFRDVPGQYKHMALDFKKSVDVARQIAQIFHGAPLDHGKDDVEPSKVRNLLDSYYGKHVLAPKIKAFGSTVVGGGDEFVPTLLSSAYIDEYLLDRLLEDRVKVIPMPSNPYEIPVVASGTKARKIAEGVSITATNPTTAKLTLNAVKLGEYYELPSELDEDSAPDILAMARMENIKAQKNAVEAAMISGDDDGTHIDSDLEALGADIAEKVWKGWRRNALANSAGGATIDFSNAIIDDTKLSTVISRMGKFGVNPAELMIIVGPAGWAQMRRLTSVFTNDKYGPQATVHTGQLASYFGSEIVVSEYMRESLNATGVYDGVTTNRASMLIVNKTRSFLGNRRPIQLKVVQDLPYYDRWLIASYRRAGFTMFTQSATEVSVAYGYNIAK